MFWGRRELAESVIIEGVERVRRHVSAIWKHKGVMQISLSDLAASPV